MDFEPSDRCKELRARLEGFVAHRVLLSEALYEAQFEEAGDPHAQPAVMEQLKAEARELGLWNLVHPDAPGVAERSAAAAARS